MEKPACLRGGPVMYSWQMEENRRMYENPGFGVLVKETQNAAPCVSTLERDKQNGAPWGEVGRERSQDSRQVSCLSHLRLL